MQNQTAARLQNQSKSKYIKVHFGLTGGKGSSIRDHAGLQAAFSLRLREELIPVNLCPDYCMRFILIPSKDRV